MRLIEYVLRVQKARGYGLDKILEKKGFICDMDGVIYHGNKLLPGVGEFLKWLKENGKSLSFPDKFRTIYTERASAKASPSRT